MKITTLCENHLFAKAYQKGKRAVTDAIAVHVMPDYKAKLLKKAHPKHIVVNRVGITVGKKIGGAVERSRVKRIIRSAYLQVIRENEVRVGSIIVIVARDGIQRMKSTELAPQLKRCFTRLSLIAGE